MLIISCNFGYLWIHVMKFCVFLNQLLKVKCQKGIVNYRQWSTRLQLSWVLYLIPQGGTISSINENDAERFINTPIRLTQVHDLVGLTPCRKFLSQLCFPFIHKCIKYIDKANQKYNLSNKIRNDKTIILNNRYKIIFF